MKITPKKIVKAFIPYGILWVYRKINIHRFFKKIENSGNKCVCSCCGNRFGRFIDAAFTPDLNSDKNRWLTNSTETICPFCGSLPRIRQLLYFFENNKDILPVSDIGVLMFAAEQPLQKFFTNNNCHCTTADLYDKNSNLIITIQKTPFLDETWELITCNHVLEHVDDYKIALKELYRILKFNGVLELMVPLDRNLPNTYEDKNIITNEDRIKHFGQWDHVRVFGNDFYDSLVNTGFKVKIIDGNDMPPEIGAKIGPADYDDNRIYICRK